MVLESSISVQFGYFPITSLYRLFCCTSARTHHYTKPNFKIPFLFIREITPLLLKIGCRTGAMRGSARCIFVSSSRNIKGNWWWHRRPIWVVGREDVVILCALLYVHLLCYVWRSCYLSLLTCYLLLQCVVSSQRASRQERKKKDISIQLIDSSAWERISYHAIKHLSRTYSIKLTIKNNKENIKTNLKKWRKYTHNTHSHTLSINLVSISILDLAISINQGLVKVEVLLLCKSFSFCSNCFYGTTVQYHHFWILIIIMISKS